MQVKSDYDEEQKHLTATHNKVCQTFGPRRSLQTTARGPNRTREAISSSRSDSLWITKKIIYLRKNCSFGTVHCNISRNIAYVRCSALELLCKSLCGPRTKKLGDTWSTAKSTLYQRTKISLHFNVLETRNTWNFPLVQLYLCRAWSSGSQPGVHGKISRGTWMAVEFSCNAIF